MSRVPTNGIFDKHATCRYLSSSGNGNFPLVYVYTKLVKKIIFDKIVFSEKGNWLIKISIVWIYVIQVRRNKTR